MSKRSFAAMLFASGALCAQEAALAWVFEDVSTQVVDKMPPGIGPVFDYAFLDINDDNCLDVVTNNHHANKPAPIWLGTPEGKFVYWQDMPERSVAGSGFSLAETDLNGDGRTDLVYTGNEGGVVVNLNDSVQIGGLPSYGARLHAEGSSPFVSFADLDGDGALEMFARPGLVYDRTFKVVEKRGTHHGSWVIADFDGDGWPDLFSGGDQHGRFPHFYGPRQMFRNNRGALEPVSTDSSLVKGLCGGVVKTADFNNDGHLDLLIVGNSQAGVEKGSPRTLPIIMLYLGDGAFNFTDVTASSGFVTSKAELSYGKVYLADIDNDGLIDIAAGGNLRMEVWRNLGGATFSRVEKMPWAGTSRIRLDDYDMDGRLDVVASGAGPGYENRKEAIRIFRNVTESGNHWLKVQVRQPDGNTQALGASVTLYACGTRTVLGKGVVASDSSSGHPRLHFGVARSERVDVEVIFPQGSERKAVTFPNVAVNRYLVITPDGKLSEVKIGG